MRKCLHDLPPGERVLQTMRRNTNSSWNYLCRLAVVRMQVAQLFGKPWCTRSGLGIVLCMELRRVGRRIGQRFDHWAAIGQRPRNRLEQERQFSRDEVIGELCPPFGIPPSTSSPPIPERRER